MSTRARACIAALLALVVVRLWIMPMGSSLAMDETTTLSNVKDGFSAMLERYQECPATTLFYGAIVLAYSLGGAREYVLRLPSLLAALLTLFLLYRLGRRLFGPHSALATVVVFACLDQVVYAAGAKAGGLWRCPGNSVREESASIWATDGCR
jgi:4-amino-4-deoxy-L-arabinose transferase-like glycosyltransferase